MTPTDLRALAAYHERLAVSQGVAAKLMGDCAKAHEIRRTAEQHLEWANKLTELANSFYALVAHQ